MTLEPGKAKTEPTMRPKTLLGCVHWMSGLASFLMAQVFPEWKLHPPEIGTVTNTFSGSPMQVEVGTANIPGAKRLANLAAQRAQGWRLASPRLSVCRHSKDAKRLRDTRPAISPITKPQSTHLERMPRAFWPMRSPYFLASALSSSEMSSKEALGVSSLQ